jgi:hypothetical protein
MRFNRLPLGGAYVKDANHESSNIRKTPTRVRILSTIGFAAVLAVAIPAVRRAQANSLIFPETNPALTVSIVSRANGDGAPGQTLEAGVLSIINGSSALAYVNSVTISFSNPSLFSSATLNPPAPVVESIQVDQNGARVPATASPPTSSTTFTFNPPFAIGPGGEPFFGLTVKLSPVSRNETNGVAYAGVTQGTAAQGVGAPLWIAFAMLGLATVTLSEGTRRRAWLIGGLLVLFAVGAPECGGDSGSGPSSMQTVVTVSASGFVVAGNASPATITGLPLKLGTITGQ